MTNNEFANMLAYAIEKKKLNHGKVVDEFIETHLSEKLEMGSFSHKPTKLTPEIIEFGKKLPKNTKISLPEITEVVTKAKAESAKVADKTSTRTGYHASEW
jgi:hypothetical protein